jgi:hypothetical protein
VQQMMNLETFVPQEVLEGVLNMNENATRV